MKRKVVYSILYLFILTLVFGTPPLKAQEPTSPPKAPSPEADAPIIVYPEISEVTAAGVTIQGAADRTVNPPALTPSYNSGNECGVSWKRLSTSSGYVYITLNTNSSAGSTNSGKWTPNLPYTGKYKVEALIPKYSAFNWPCSSPYNAPVGPGTSNPPTSDARYKVVHAGGPTPATRSQNPPNNQWLNLGTFSFNAGTGGYIQLKDLNGEPNLKRTIAFSAVRFTWVGTSNISGRITDDSSNPVSGVTVNVGSKSTTTNSNGDYTISTLSQGSYTVTPSKAGYTFTPASKTVSVPPNGTGQNFTGTLSNFSISGQVVDNSGNPLSGVEISDGAGHSASTDSSGNYSVTGLTAGTYTLTPNKTGYSTCVPASRVVTGPPNQTGQDFACEPDPVYSISGKITDEQGNAISGVTVSDNKGHTTSTDANGDYVINNLLPDTYQVTASKTGYAFSPQSHEVTITMSNATDQNFTGQMVYSISGQVLDNNNQPLAGIPIAILGPQYPTVNTDGNGDYLADNLSKGFYYVKPSSIGADYTLSPQIIRVQLPPSAIDQDFTGTPRFGKLTGRVTNKSTGAAVANARVSVAGKVVETNASGYYTVNEIMLGNHTVRVSASNYKDHKSNVDIQVNSTATKNVALEPIRADGYRLPYPGGKTYQCTQGNGGSFSHYYPTNWYSFDFGIPKSGDLVTPRDGKVIRVKENSTAGGCSSSYKNSSNYVAIQHSDGTVSWYFHLQPWSVPVSVGQYVKSGQVIGKVGLTGWVCGAHLHYERRANSWTYQSVQTRFLDVSSNGGIPVTGGWYKSGNYLNAAAAESIPLVGPQADTILPTGSVNLKMTGQPTYTVILNAFDYDSGVSQMRLAKSESDLQITAWQPYTETADWTDYEVWAQFKDAANNVSVVYSTSVEAVSFIPIQPAFTINPTICVGTRPQVVNQSTPLCEQCGWHWDMGDNNHSYDIDFGLPYPYMGYSDPGSYTVTLTVANIDSITSTTRQVEALSSPAPVFTITRSGNTVTVEADADAANYTWDFGDSTTATGRIATHTYTSTEVLEQGVPIRLTVEGQNGCTSSGFEYVTTADSANNDVYIPIIIK